MRDVHGDQQPRAPLGAGFAPLGTPVSRVDGIAKVTGHARYAAEHPAPHLAWGVVVSSTIAKGRIERVASERALAVPGVLAVLSHENRPKMRRLGFMY